MTYDSRVDTQRHIDKVRMHLMIIVHELYQRSYNHDASKLVSPEKEALDIFTPLLENFTYGSEEYYANLDKLKPAIQHHYSKNRHHPEFYSDDGVNGMDLIDLVEMLCDWKAATLRHGDGDILHSIDINARRFNLSPQLVGILTNTVIRLEWE